MPLRADRQTTHPFEHHDILAAPISNNPAAESIALTQAQIKVLSNTSENDREALALYRDDSLQA